MNPLPRTIAAVSAVLALTLPAAAWSQTADGLSLRLDAASAAAAASRESARGISAREEGYRGLQRILPRIQEIQVRILDAWLREKTAVPMVFAAYRVTPGPNCNDLDDLSCYAYRFSVKPVYAVNADQLKKYHSEAIEAIAQSGLGMDQIAGLLETESKNSAYNPQERAVLTRLAAKAGSYLAKDGIASTLATAHRSALQRLVGTRGENVEVSGPERIGLMNRTSALLKMNESAADEVAAGISNLNEVYDDYVELMVDVRDPLKTVYVYFGGSEDRAWGVDRSLGYDLAAVSAARVTNASLKLRLIAEAKENSAAGAPSSDDEIAGIVYAWGGSSPSFVTREQANDADAVVEIINAAMRRNERR